MRSTPQLFFAALGAVLLVSACTSSNPEAPLPALMTDNAEFAGDFDPSLNAFVLTPLPSAGDDARVPVELVARLLPPAPGEPGVRLEVSLRNVGREPLHAPVTVAVSHLTPPTVRVTNADAVEMPEGGDSPVYVFDYSEALGAAGVLAPGAVSAARVWEFESPSRAAFSFRVMVHVGLEPAPAFIAGTVFWDRNRNGRQDDGEEPVRALALLRMGDGIPQMAPTDDRGRFRIPVRLPGLYTLTVRPVERPLCFEPPAPLEIVVPAGPDGGPQDFEHADIALAPCAGPIFDVIITDLAPEQIEGDPFRLIGAELHGDRLAMRVGYSGCSPEHPLRLWVSRQFRESEPPWTWMRLAHDSRGELCEAYFEREVEFDLELVRRAIVRAYGERQRVVLGLLDFEGDVASEFEFGP